MSQEYSANNSKSFLYYLSFVLIGLILIDKSLHNRSLKLNPQKLTSSVSHVQNLDSLEDPNILECKHGICKICFLIWNKRSNLCPICKRKFT